jgi:hypothetical protein
MLRDFRWVMRTGWKDIVDRSNCIKIPIISLSDVAIACGHPHASTWDCIRSVMHDESCDSAASGREAMCHDNLHIHPVFIPCCATQLSHNIWFNAWRIARCRSIRAEPRSPVGHRPTEMTLSPSAGAINVLWTGLVRNLPS